MGACSDNSTTFLASLGYNVVRQPSEGLAPLDLIGIANGSTIHLGHVAQLITNGPEELPAVTRDLDAAEISGRKTSKLDVSLGLSIFSAIVTALGGDASVTANYARARTLQFSYSSVKKDRANVIALGDYLDQGEVKWDQLVLQEYLLGSGRLLVVLEIVKSNKFLVAAFRRNNAGLDVDVPAIKGIIGGNIQVNREAENQLDVAYEGDKRLVFGFICAELFARENAATGELRLGFRPLPAGSVTAGVSADLSTAAVATLIAPGGTLATLPRAAANA